MGIVRLLAKAWILFCLFAAGHAVRMALEGALPSEALPAILVCALLFCAMGLLFVGGFGVSGGWTGALSWRRPADLVPGFSEMVFLAFVLLSFLNQAFAAPLVSGRGLADAIESAIYFAVPGQRDVTAGLLSCRFGGGQSFAAAFTWLLAIVFLGSALSRVKLAAGLIRLEQDARPRPLNPAIRAFLFGAVAVAGIQFLFVGTAFAWLGCGAYSGITGALLTGLAPLMLAYCIMAALASLLASGQE